MNKTQLAYFFVYRRQSRDCFIIIYIGVFTYHYRLMDGQGGSSNGPDFAQEKIANDLVVVWKRGADISFPVREGQCACSCGNKMYVFGGVVQVEGQELLESNELLCFDG